MKNFFTNTQSILLRDGNIKKTLESHFNYWLRKVDKEGSRDYTNLCETKINLSQLKSTITEKFDFQAQIILTDLKNNQLRKENIIGIGQILMPQMKYYRKNIIVDNYIIVEWQHISIMNDKNEVLNYEQIPYNLY